jgi:hypothetical protein
MREGPVVVVISADQQLFPKMHARTPTAAGVSGCVISADQQLRSRICSHIRGTCLIKSDHIARVNGVVQQRIWGQL